MPRLPSRVSCLLACSAISSALAAQGGRQLFQHTGFGNYGIGGFGSAVCVVGDVDGDGRPDVAAGDPYFQVYQGGAGRVVLLSGNDGSILRTLTSTDLVGDMVARLDDVDNDQVPDVVTASTTNSTGYGNGISGPKAVTVFSGATGSIVQSFAIAPNAITAVGDWNNDQQPDLAIENGGAVEVYGAASGSLVTTIPTGAVSLASVREYGTAARRLVVAQASGGVAAYSSSGSIYWSRSGFSSLADSGDLDGDLIGDVIALQVSGAFAEVLSGADGSTLLTVPGGTHVAGGADLDGDGLLDVAVGDSATNTVRAFSGFAGSLLLSYSGWEATDGMGRGVAMTQAAGATSRAAVVAGAPRRFNGTQDAGSVHAIALAAPGEIDGRIEVTGQGCNFQAWKLRPLGDPPKPGQTASLRFRSASTNGPMWNLHVYGLSNTSYNGVPLPTPLPSQILSSCVQLGVSADVVELFGGVWVNFAVPAIPSAVGVDVYFQALEFSAFQGVTNFETSGVARISIGN